MSWGRHRRDCAPKASMPAPAVPDSSGSDGHCAFGSAIVEASCGCAVTSNWLASITRFASALSTNILNGASSRVPATGASAISISRPSERYLTSGVDGDGRRLVRSLRNKPPLALLYDLAPPIHNANARELQRDVDSDIVFHGCPPSQMPGADSTS